jgi:hypothetical protein
MDDGIRQRRSSYNWLERFVNYTNSIETPLEFQLWVGISILAAALQRNVRVRIFTKEWLYPNLYVILVSPSGTCHKGTIMGAGIKLIQQWNDVINIIQGKTTTPALADELIRITEERGESIAYVYSPELKSTTTTDARPERFISDMTDLYDTHDVMKWLTRSRRGMFEGVPELKNVCINFLAGTTPRDLATRAYGEVVGGGFSARVVFVYREACGRRIIELTDKELARLDKEEKELAAELGHIIHKVKGDFATTDKAREFYRGWKEKLNARIDREDDEAMKSYLDRKAMQLWKVAMVCSVAESSRLVIEPKHLRQADWALGRVENTIRHIFAEVGDTQVERDKKKILAILNQGPLTRTALGRRLSRLKARQLDELIADLLRNEQIDLEEGESASGKGRKLTLIKLKEESDGS